jgi:pimeloyl-ACP methyl ester carboxylesterase
VMWPIGSTRPCSAARAGSTPAEIFRSQRAWAERRYSIVHWYQAPRGGHFAALEQPELFAEDLRRFRVLVFDRAAH